MADGPASHSYGLVLFSSCFSFYVLVSIVSVMCMDSCGVRLVSSVFRLILSEVTTTTDSNASC